MSSLHKHPSILYAPRPIPPYCHPRTLRYVLLQIPLHVLLWTPDLVAHTKLSNDRENILISWKEEMHLFHREGGDDGKFRCFYVYNRLISKGEKGSSAMEQGVRDEDIA